MSLSKGAQAAAAGLPVARRVRLPKGLDQLPSRDLIGPPCPLSNLRPMFYAPLFPSLPQSTPFPLSIHPYSLSEFPSSSIASNRAQLRLQRTKQKLHAADLEWRLTRYRVDAFNQDFWARTNTAFLLARDAYLGQHPVVEGTEVDLSPFYAHHLASTKEHYAAYNGQLWRLQAALMWPALKAATRLWQWRWEVWKAGGEQESG